MHDLDARTALNKQWHPAVAEGAFDISDDTLNEILRAAPRNGTVIDVGCHGWVIPALAEKEGRFDLHHFGADLGNTPPPGRPSGVGFLPIPRDGAVFSGPIADLTISRHCLEHSAQPIDLFAALLHATRPDGFIYVEAPSELACQSTSSDDPRDHEFKCFWDDPTHIRPWPPAALYRLALSFGAYPMRCGRLTRWGIPCSAVLAQKTHDQTQYRYVSLSDTPFGVGSALSKIWQPAPA
jgi:hypothetical protein